jgi:hypothetical protein
MIEEKKKEMKKKYLELSKTPLSNDDINETKNYKKARFTFFFKSKPNEEQESRLTTAKIFKKNSCENNKKELIKNIEEEELFNNNPDIIYKSIDVNNEIQIYLKSILLLVYSFKFFNNLCKLELILNDSYLPEFFSFFENEVFDQENKSINLSLLKEFHLIDIITSRFIRLTNLNLEINSLDSLSFKKILEGIYNNSSLVSLYISFFTSDVTYLQQNIYRLFISNNSHDDDILKKQKWREDSELKILDKFLDNFCLNLQILFDLIKIKDFQILGFNFNIPDIIMTKQRYLLAIIKFILNLLLYTTNKDAIFQKVTILAPKIKFDNEFYPFINKFLRNINPKNNNKIMRELNFQLQLYKIINIKNIISESLVILNIGDCDFYTFEELILNLTSYRFCINSSLSKLSISLIKSLFILDIKIYNLLFKLFNIKISQLKEVNLYTNLIIKSEKTYIFLLNIFCYNWISLCTLTFSQNSEKIILSQECESERKKIKYLVPGSLENELLSPEDKELKKKIFNGKPFLKFDEVFWYLKYIFQIRYKCDEIKYKNKNISLSKFLINKILGYLHFEKYMRIEHNLVKYTSQEQ